MIKEEDDEEDEKSSSFNDDSCNDAQHGCMRQQWCKGNNRCSRRI